MDICLLLNLAQKSIAGRQQAVHGHPEQHAIGHYLLFGHKARILESVAGLEESDF
jgi:hypothetical protein